MTTENPIYLILSKSENHLEINDNHTTTSALGHEIHISRFILLALLDQKKIDVLNSTIVTINEDRFFLYNKIFKNVITWSDYHNNHNNHNTNVIDLTSYILNCCYKTRNDEINEINEINRRLDFNLESFERTDQMNNYINDFNFYKLDDSDSTYLDIIKNKFIVIHLRYNIGISNKDYLLKIVGKIGNNTKIVVFGVERLDGIQLNNVLFINSLQVYASFLHHENCELLITQWSGGGQLSQYCSNGKIMYYFDHYPSLNYEIHYDKYQQIANSKNNILSYWDFKCSTDCKRSYYKTLDFMLENL